MLWKSQGIYRQTGAPGYRYGVVRQILARGSTPEPRKRGYAKMRLWPHFRGHSMAARVTPPATHCHVTPLSVVLTSFQIWAPGFDKITLQSQKLSLQAFNHQLNGEPLFHAMNLETCKRGIISRI